MADSGCCSRRKAEELISRGKVKLNGHPVKLGDKCGFKDIITIDGERIYMPRKKNLLYIMMNKPRGGYAYTVVDLGAPIGEDVAAQIRAMDDVLRVRVI